MPKKISLVGRRFSRLTVLGELPERDKQHDIRYLCLCSCGKTTIVRARGLRMGKTTSCGCFHREHSKIALKHGSCHVPEYRIWISMRCRCQNVKSTGYELYGGRGIKVCERWNEFGNFIVDMGKRPSQKHSIDRIDNDGNYEPENCRWATQTQQSNNMRSNRLITFNGETKTLGEWAQQVGMRRSTLVARLDVQKLPVEQALTLPVWRWQIHIAKDVLEKMYKIDKLSQRKMGKRLGCDPGTIRYKLRWYKIID